MNKVMHGDCLTESEQIESGSVDLILTDPPYGIIENYKNCEWDSAIEPIKLFDVANRILRKNGKMVLFSMEPYTSQLIINAIPNLPFSYRAIWEKPMHGNGAQFKCNKAMLGYYEDILVFSKCHPKHDFERFHPLREYAKKCSSYIGMGRKERSRLLGHRGSDHFLESHGDPLQFSLCKEETYNELIEVFGIDKMQGFKPFAELKPIDVEYRKNLIMEMTEAYPSTFNLWEGKKYKSNILKYAKDCDGYHPTQKPVLLLEDLIKTFSNEGDLVVDLTAGSGSTAVACRNTGRNYIVIEKEQKYIDIINKRIAEHEQQLALIPQL